MELFSITCTTCGAKLKVRDAAAIGQILACPKCQSMVQVVPPAGWKEPAQILEAAAGTRNFAQAENAKSDPGRGDGGQRTARVREPNAEKLARTEKTASRDGAPTSAKANDRSSPNRARNEAGRESQPEKARRASAKPALPVARPLPEESRPEPVAAVAPPRRVALGFMPMLGLITSPKFGILFSASVMGCVLCVSALWAWLAAGDERSTGDQAVASTNHSPPSLNTPSHNKKLPAKKTPGKPKAKPSPASREKQRDVAASSDIAKGEDANQEQPADEEDRVPGDVSVDDGAAESDPAANSDASGDQNNRGQSESDPNDSSAVDAEPASEVGDNQPTTADDESADVDLDADSASADEAGSEADPDEPSDAVPSDAEPSDAVPSDDAADTDLANNDDDPRAQVPTPSRVDVAARLADRLPAIEFDETTLSEALDLLSQLSTLNILLDAELISEVGATPGDKITLRLNETSLGEALAAVLRQRGLVYEVEGDLVLVKPKHAQQ